MRVQGRLSKWNGERGFGFLSPLDGSADVFVHVTAFARDGRTPVVGELVSFETETGPNGKLRAIRVQRAGDKPARRASNARRSNGLLQSVLSMLVLVGIGAALFQRFGPGSEDVPAPAPARLADPTPVGPGFHCDGRTMCSQMTSCEEATWFLRNCPNTQMDGNGDGEPCEQQWCQ